MEGSPYRRVLALGMLATCLPLPAAQLPLRHYSTADGLASNAVFGITPDPHGFLWFATSEGLSRFDGYGFANQTESTGLPHSTVSQVLIGPDGSYWLATPTGLVRFRPGVPPPDPGRMTVIRPNGRPASANITVLLLDHSGKLWCGTEAGLYTVEDPAGPKPRLVERQIGLPGIVYGDSDVQGLVEDVEGAVWVGVTEGTLYKIRPDRQVERNTFTREPHGEILHLLADRKGRIWVGARLGLFRSVGASHPGANGFERLSGKGTPLPASRVFQLLETPDGSVWVGMYGCLGHFPSDGSPPRAWTKEDGLPSRGVLSLGQDRNGNLWLGTDDLGVFKLVDRGILTYGEGEGIGGHAIYSIAETLRGDLFVGANHESGHFHVGELVGKGFRMVSPRVPRPIDFHGWRPARVLLQDRQGEWWLASSQGLCRYPRLDRPAQLAATPPKAVYTTRDGLGADSVIRLYEDREGNIWVGGETAKIVYWNRREQKFTRVTTEGEPETPSAFGEDGAGNVWFGDESGRIWRVRHGHAARVPSPARREWIRDILLDRAGRLWVATGSQGLLRFDQPTAAEPAFRQYGYTDGLSSLHVLSLAEDLHGVIYLGTGSGIDRLDPDRGLVRHYTALDGIATGQVHTAYRDHGGTLWFGTAHGLTRLQPHDGPTAGSPPTLLTGLSIGGHRMPVSEAGETAMSHIEVQPGQNQIQFDFVGLSYSPANGLRYQYRLGDDPWSVPTDSRSVHYAALAPGSYRFAVRAINSEGQTSNTPASVEFRVAPPFWRQAWFQGLLLAMAAAGVVWVHRVRVARLLEIERVRTRIASDLHDDIGSSLSQIAILSEVAQKRTAGGIAGEPIERIGALSRELLDSISDIVWAIQPRKDHLSDLKQRMRRFAAEVLSARNVTIEWTVGTTGRDLELNADLRRQVYLIFKESISNIAQHSQATEAHVTLQVVARELMLEVTDNGRGFEWRENHEGNGLASMTLRATRLGGVLQVNSEGRGTTVRLRAPLPD